jgi:hypothetical protein
MISLRAALAGVVLAAGAASAQGPVLNPSNGHYYERVLSLGITWPAAKTAAESMSHMGLSGHLATLTSAAENDWVFTNLAPPLNGYWMGAFQDKASPSYSEPKGGWAWVTGETWAFTSWYTGEPNNVSNAEHAAFDFYVQAWNDFGAGEKTEGFVVEYEKTPAIYCTAKVNSCGTLPTVTYDGASSASAASGFRIQVSQARKGKHGILLYGTTGRAALPFHGGTLCLAPPPRLAVAVAATSFMTQPCSGTLSLDLNAFAAGTLGGNPIPDLSVPGSVVNCQFWGRDTPGNSLLSNALEYTVGV